MNTIGEFLSRYKQFTPPPLVVARAVAEAIHSTLGIEVAPETIQVRNGRAQVAVSSVEKTEILLNQERIIAAARPLGAEHVHKLG